MNLSLFEPPVDRHHRKSHQYVEEAKVKRIEHQAAAEHHGALTQLYAERISRFKAHLGKTLPARSDTGDSEHGADDGALSAASLP